MSGRRFRRAGALLAGMVLTVGACSSNGKSETDTAADPPRSSAATTTTMAPQRGGLLTVGQFSRETGLDPAKLTGGGTVGGMEHMAIYDVLMRYDNKTAKYEPRTAESLTPNEDFSVWTLKLRPNIKFGDGTDYDATAVKYVHDREVKEGATSPKGQFTGAVQSVEVIDKLTLRYTLTRPWVGFPYVLSGVNGVVYSPAAHQKAGDTFNTAPGDAGAGPFKVKSYKPGEALELERNPNYWGGDVYLDGLKFIFVGGADATFEALRSSTLQAAYVRSNAIVDNAKQQKFGAIEMPTVAGNLANLNAAKGPTANLKVREAVAAAIDPKVIVDRVFDGKGQPSSSPFANFPWDPKVEGPKYDVEKAKQLVAQAKAEGWDGKIRVLAPNPPEGAAWGQAVQAQLRAAGMDVALDTTKDTQQVVLQMVIQQDFDVAVGAYGLLDESDGNYLALLSTFGSKRYGYGSPDMLAAVDQLRTADTDAKRVAAYKAISEVWVRDVPAVVTTNIMQALVHSPKLHDLQRTAMSSVLFDKAWLEK